MSRLGFNEAMALMHLPETRLIRTNKRDGSCVHDIVPGRRVESELAEKIKSHPQVTPCEDGFWPGLSQTWKVVL
jgi:hypothetical protein